MSRPNNRTAFTLVELLVVVTIIAVLIALLLPAIKKSKEIARISVCGSNLRQVSIALFAYANENRNFGPAYQHGGADSPTGTAWGNEANWSQILFGGKEENGNLPGYPTRVEYSGRRKINPYVSGWEVFHCPSDTGPEWFPSETSWYDWTGCSYIYNANGHSLTPGPDPKLHYPVFYSRPFEQFAHHSRQVLVGDSNVRYAWAYWTNLIADGGPHAVEYYWHDPPGDHPGVPYHTWGYFGAFDVFFYDVKSNVAFLDGHVTFMPLGPYGAADYRVNTATYILDPSVP